MEFEGKMGVERQIAMEMAMERGETAIAEGRWR
jgi:hypothetical protein